MLKSATGLLAILLCSFMGRGETLFVDVVPVWNGQEIQVPSEPLPTASGETIRFTRVAFLLSNPSIQSDQGQWLGVSNWQALIDFSGVSTPVTFANLPPAQYQNIRFHLGLDSETNAASPNQYPALHPLNPLVNKLHWSPQGGYIFLALEGYAVQENGDELGFAYHLGNDEAYTRFTCPLSLELNQNQRAQLSIHLDRIFAGTPPLQVRAQTSTHSRDGDPLAAHIKQQVSGSFTLKQVAFRKSLTGTQPERTVPDMVGTPYRFTLPKRFPIPALPLDFPLSNERVALGKHLFHDQGLSKDGSISCASCHEHAAAFTDRNTVSTGVDGQTGTRNSMPLANLAWKTSFFWDGRAPGLRQQVLDPIQDPVEMHQDLGQLVEHLQAHPDYPARFEAAFGDPEITPERLAVSLEQFLLTLTSFDSKFDQAAGGQVSLSEQEKRGFELFMTEYDPRREQFGADCFHCHGGVFFTDHSFHNNGLEPGNDLGLEIATGKASDRFKFSTPSLRNVALTAPYMHDGRFETLEEVVEHYSSGIHRSPTLDPNLAKHPSDGIPLTDADQAALVAFLKTLTDPQY